MLREILNNKYIQGSLLIIIFVLFNVVYNHKSIDINDKDNIDSLNLKIEYLEEVILTYERVELINEKLMKVNSQSISNYKGIVFGLEEVIRVLKIVSIEAIKSNPNISNEYKIEKISSINKIL